MDILTFGTLVCVSFIPPEAKFAKCDPVPTLSSLWCDFDSPPGLCNGAKYSLKYSGCNPRAYFLDPAVPAKYIKPVVWWEEYEESPGVYVKKPVCPDFKRIQK